MAFFIATWPPHVLHQMFRRFAHVLSNMLRRPTVTSLEETTSDAPFVCAPPARSIASYWLLHVR